MIKLTVFTPTYNRAEFLHIAYEALKRQTCKDFCWLIVDDGSTDNTKETVEPWLGEKDFPVRYVFKENGGLQTAYIEAIKNIDTELCLCVDSDDYLLDDGVERLLDFWDRNGSEKYAGVVALNCFDNGEIVGGLFPGDLRETNHKDIGNGLQGRTDNDVVRMYRTKVYECTTPALSYPGERSLNAERQFIQISEKYDFVVLNEPIVVVNYQPDGMTGNIFKTYFKSPNCWADYRELVLSTDRYPLKKYFRMAAHYVAECFIAKRRVFHKNLHRKGIVLIAFFPGIFLYLWLIRSAESADSFSYVMKNKK